MYPCICTPPEAKATNFPAAALRALSYYSNPRLHVHVHLLARKLPFPTAHPPASPSSPVGAATPSARRPALRPGINRQPSLPLCSSQTGPQPNVAACTSNSNMPAATFHSSTRYCPQRRSPPYLRSLSLQLRTPFSLSNFYPLVPVPHLPFPPAPCLRLPASLLHDLGPGKVHLGVRRHELLEHLLLLQLVAGGQTQSLLALVELRRSRQRGGCRGGGVRAGSRGMLWQVTAGYGTRTAIKSAKSTDVTAVASQTK